MTMASSNLANIPAEILQDICSYLYDTHPASLSSLSSVNKHLCKASSSWIFRQINLKVKGTHSLTKELTSLCNILEHRDAFGALHRLAVSGFIQLYRDDEVEPPPTKWELNNKNWDAYEEIYGEARIEHSFYPRPSVTAEELAPFFELMVSVIKHAYQLRYLDYNCKNPVPMNIVRALEQFRPTCRLHIEHFQYRDLDNTMRIPKEMPLVRSPVLHSIKVRHVDRTSDGVDNYNREAMFRTIRGAIPNLKRVEFIQCHAPSSRELSLRMNDPRPEWKGFDTSFGPDHRVDLDFFACSDFLTPTILHEFGNALNYEKLQHLELLHDSGTRALRYFTRRVKFHQLHSLALVISKPWPDDDQQWPGIPSVDPATFLMSLAPLKSLRVCGFIAEETFSAILSHHGSRLRDLKIQPNSDTYWRTGTFQRCCLGLDELRRVPDACPHLEDLLIPVQRTKSKGKEVECYKALATCQSLRHLFIELKCDKPNALPLHTALVPVGHTVAASDSDSDLEEGDNPPPTVNSPMYPYNTRTVAVPNIAHIKRAFQNCAMDESLASSIWKLIAGRKQGVPLQSLKLYPVGAANFGSGGSGYHVEAWTRIMSRAYLLERPPRDDASFIDDVIVNELGKRSRDAHIAQDRESDKMSYMKNSTDELLNEKAFRRIWPNRSSEHSVDWRDDWFSLPLQVDEVNNQ